MPRVENIGANVDDWYDNEADGDGSSTNDVCRNCYEELECDSHAFELPINGHNSEPHGDDGWGGDVDHPCYEEEYLTGYAYPCANCTKKLRKADN